MRRVLRSRIGLAAGLASAFLLGGATLGAVQMAGASGKGVTYQACLSTRGVLSRVGIKADLLEFCRAPGPSRRPGAAGPRRRARGARPRGGEGLRRAEGALWARVRLLGGPLPGD
jgi:hypothetical protein